MMLQQALPDARHCLRRAFEARCRANAASDAAMRVFWTDMEARWLVLASSYDCVERTSDFLTSLQFARCRTPNLG